MSQALAIQLGTADKKREPNADYASPAPASQHAAARSLTLGLPWGQRERWRWRCPSPTLSFTRTNRVDGCVWIIGLDGGDMEPRPTLQVQFLSVVDTTSGGPAPVNIVRNPGLAHTAAFPVAVRSRSHATPRHRLLAPLIRHGPPPSGRSGQRRPDRVVLVTNTRSCPSSRRADPARRSAPRRARAMALDTDAPRSRPDASAAVHPLLSDDGSTAAGETAEELDARYAPYARRDAYGTMGRGPLPAAQAARLALAAAVLLPLRFVAGMLVLLLYYLVCRVCTLFVDADEGRPRLAGWRRKAVLRAGCALSRAMLFVFGFYWIRETHRRLPNAEVSSGVPCPY